MQVMKPFWRQSQRIFEKGMKMSNQAEELVSTPKNQLEKVADHNRRAVFFMMVGLLCVVLGFGYGFWQMWEANNKLVQNMTDLQNQLQSINQQTTHVQQGMANLHDVVQQAQAMAARQEKMFAEWQNSQQDLTEIYLQLNFLNAQLDALPLPVSPLSNVQNALANKASAAATSWWQAIVDKLMAMLSKIVIVHYNPTDIKPLVAPEAKTFIYQNLHAQMENVMWAVLHRNNEIYHSGLIRMSQWINTYFALDKAQTQNVLKEIQRLQTVQLPMSQPVNVTKAT